MPLSISSAARQLSDGNLVGTVLGAATNSAGLPDMISFYGATPVAQAAGNAQAAITRGQACGRIGTFSSTQSPASCTANTTIETTLTIQSGTGGAFLAATTDVVYVNKPTSQAGLGYGNTRISSSNTLGITFNNATAASLTPTASELYSGVLLRGFNPLTATLSPVSVAPNTRAEQLFTVTGIRAGELIQVSKPTQQVGLDIVGVRAAANNQVGGVGTMRRRSAK